MSHIKGCTYVCKSKETLMNLICVKYVVFLRVSSIQFRSVQSFSHVWLFVTPWITARQAFLFISNSWSLPKLMSIESVMPSSHLILCHPLLLLPSIFPSIRVFSNESTLCMRWPKYWSFSFSISPCNEHPELIFRMDWLDLLAVQRTLKSLLQHLGWVKTSPHILRFVGTVDVSLLYKGRGNPVILCPSNLSVFSRDGSKRGDTCNINYTPCFVGTLHSQN